MRLKNAMCQRALLRPGEIRDRLTAKLLVPPSPAAERAQPLDELLEVHRPSTAVHIHIHTKHTIKKQANKPENSSQTSRSPYERKAPGREKRTLRQRWRSSAPRAGCSLFAGARGTRRGRSSPSHHYISHSRSSDESESEIELEVGWRNGVQEGGPWRGG